MSNKDVIVEISQPEIIVEVEQVEVVTEVVVGQKGDSAYKQAVEGGYTGTLEEFEAQLNDLPELTGGADTGLHKHDQMYYTESEVDGQMATKMNLDGSNSAIDTLTFKTTGQSTDPLPEGKMRWNSTEHTLDVGMDGAGIVQQVGMETFYPKAKNKDTVTIHNGSLVEYMGTLGNSGVMLIKRSTAVMPMPNQVLGVATEEIAPNAEGRITWFGQVRAIQTNGANYGETWVDGDILYNNPNYLGGLTKVMPTAPFPTAIVAVVMRAHASKGSLFVRPDFLPYLGMLSDVQITNPLNGQVLAYNGTLGRWENGNPSTLQDTTSANNAKVEALTGGVLVSRNVVDGATTLTVQGATSSWGRLAEFKIGSVIKAFISGVGAYQTDSGMANYGFGADHAYVKVPSTGTEISRNVADANPALIVNQQHASSTGNIANFKFGGADKAYVTKDGDLYNNFTYTRGVSNKTTPNNAYLILDDTGSTIRRNVADANPALIVNQVNASSTGKILDLQFGGASKASFTKDGKLNIQEIQNDTNYVNSFILTKVGGTTIGRYVADNGSCLVVNQANASSTGLITDFQFGGVSKASVDKTGYIYSTAGIQSDVIVYTPSIANATNTFARIYFNTTGIVAQRNIGDSETCLKVNQAHASSTGNIAEFQFNGTTKLAIDKDGLLPASNVVNTPAGNISATTVQGAINELDTEKADKLFATNLVTNGDFSNGTTGWSGVNTTISASNNELTATATARYGVVRQAKTLVIGNKYYVRANVKTSSYQDVKAQLDTGAVYCYSNNVYNSISFITTATNTSVNFVIQDNRASGWTPNYVKNVIIVDLTATFGAGKEPTKNEFETMLSTFPNYWFNGTAELVNIANLAQLKADKTQEAWITPTLLNSWLNNGSATASFQYMKDSLGFVHIKGTIKGGSSGTVVFTLPVGYRPAAQINAIGLDVNATTKIISIANNGNVTLWGAYTSSVSLDGIIFKAEV